MKRISYGRIQHDGRTTAGILCPSRCDHQRGVNPFHGVLESAVRVDLWLQKDVNTVR